MKLINFGFLPSLLIAVFLPASLIACDASAPGLSEAEDISPDENLPLVVYTVNNPLAYLAKRIGGELVDVRFPVLEGIDPAFWQPSAEQIVEYQSADIILLNGANYAGWLSLASLPREKLVDTSYRFKDRWISNEEVLTHIHGPEGEHNHTSVATHFWLDLTLASAQAKEISLAFEKANPENSEKYTLRFEQLYSELKSLDAMFNEVAAQYRDQVVAFSHPVYQYFERRYGLNGLTFHFEPNELPEDTEWMKFKSKVEQNQIRTMIWEAEPLPEIRSELKKLGVNIIVIEPGASRSVENSFVQTMRDNLQRWGSASAD